VAIEEVLPGVFHWTARHPTMGGVVSSYWLEGEGVLFDPLVPEAEGVEWFAGRAREPQAILLSNRHHSRESGRFVEQFGCSVHASRPGMHEFAGRDLEVEPFDFGDELPGGAVAHEMGAICPDDSALHLPGARALVLADGVVRGGAVGEHGPLGFVPDSLMDDPPGTKQGLLDSIGTLLGGLDFEHLLLAHGGPVIGDGRVLLEDLVAAGGRTAFEM
jgi:hypothetical protein